MSEKYKINDPDGLYFVTFTVIKWVDVFTRPNYCDEIINSLKYCQKNKGLEIYAWCIMTNHMHLIISKSGRHSISSIVRDFRKYTSVRIVNKIITNESESRKNWMLKLFRDAANKSKGHIKYKFWKSNYHPIELDTDEKLAQRMEYIHNNPVVAEIVYDPVDYVYSSASSFFLDKPGLLKIKRLD